MKTLKIYQAHFGPVYIKMAMLYENMGILEVEHDHYAKAYDYLKKSLAINLTNFGTDHPDVAQSYINLGDLFYTEGDPDQAMKNYEKALRIRKNIFQEKHPLIATTYNKMAQVQLLKNNFDAALQSCQLALIANIRDFQDSSSLVNPKINISFDDNILLESLHIKANTLAKESRVDQDQKKLDFSLQTYLLCADLVDKIRSSHLNFEDKIKMGEESTHIFESAIDVCYQLYHLTDHPDYLNSAFNLSERSRASVLRLALADISAKKFGGIPDSLLVFEKKIKNDITYYENKIQDAKENLYDSDTTKINNYSRHLFSRNRTYDSLIEAFERNYPKYYDLKYQNKLVDTDKLKQKLKEMQTTVVDYFLGDSALYTFVISDTNYVLLKNKISGNFGDQIKQYRKNISPNEILGDPQKVFSDFVANSRELYAMLIEPINRYIPAAVSHLTIIPSGILAIIPFESLLTNDHIPVKADYAHLPYLIRKFNISYAYSATLWSNQAKDVKQWKTQFAGYAPAYNTTLLASSRELEPFGDFRNNITNLKFTKEEVTDAEKVFPGKVFTGFAATESAFKSNKGETRIIHLAMHALVDDTHPLSSKLIFAPDQKDSLNDGFLNAYELYNMSINADMVVLSACNTGYGKITRGEGVMSLSRAFRYAGCKSLVMSLWQADDKTTATIMKLFYQNLAAGQQKDEALRHAKLSYLDHADPLTAHPYFWDAFIVSGNIDKIEDSGLMARVGYRWLIFGILILSILSYFAYFMIKRTSLSHTPH